MCSGPSEVHAGGDDFRKLSDTIEDDIEATGAELVALKDRAGTGQCEERRVDGGGGACSTRTEAHVLLLHASSTLAGS